MKATMTGALLVPVMLMALAGCSRAPRFGARPSVAVSSGAKMAASTSAAMMISPVMAIGLRRKVSQPT